MRTFVIVLLAAPLLSAQEPPKITVETRARLSEVIKAIEKASGCRIPIAPIVEDKEISVSIREAGFFQALDAVCRAHGNLRSFDPAVSRHGRDHTLTLTAGAPIDFPTGYSGPFKVFVTAMNGMKSRSVDGVQAWSLIHLVFMAPPSMPVDNRGAWKILEARDAEGKSVLLPEDDWPREQISIADSDFFYGNLITTTQYFRAFDLDRGLALLKGEVNASVCDFKEALIELTPGKEADVPVGKIRVDGVSEPEANSWRIALTLKPTAPEARLLQLLDSRVQVDSVNWDYLNVPRDGHSFEIEAFRAARKPSWVRLRFRTGARPVTVPFELRDVRFKKE